MPRPDELIARRRLQAALVTTYGEDEALLQRAFGGLPTALVLHPRPGEAAPACLADPPHAQTQGGGRPS